jgi:hypothetical protein
MVEGGLDKRVRESGEEEIRRCLGFSREET